MGVTRGGHETTVRRSTMRVRWVGIGLVIAVLASTVTGCSSGEGPDPKLEAMINDPDAALDFLYPDGVVEPGTSPIAIEYIRDRDWNPQGFDTLAQMLDAAATAHRTKDDPRSELSALAATDTINLLAERDTLPDTIDDSIGHIIANYIVDVNFLAGIGSIPPSYEQLGDPIYLDLPPGAHFTSASFRIVLLQVLTSDSAAEQIFDAANHLANIRVALSITEYTNTHQGTNTEQDTNTEQEPGRNTDQDGVFSAARRGGILLGYLVGAAASTGNTAEEWTTTVANTLAASPDELPAPGATLADYITTQATQLGQRYAPGPTPTTPAYPTQDHRDPSDWFVTVATWAFIEAVVLQLGQADLLDPPAPDYDPPWFDDNEFDPDIARQDPDAFREYAISASTGWYDTIATTERSISREANNW